MSQPKNKPIDLAMQVVLGTKSNMTMTEFNQHHDLVQELIALVGPGKAWRMIEEAEQIMAMVDPTNVRISDNM